MKEALADALARMGARGEGAASVICPTPRRPIEVEPQREDDQAVSTETKSAQAQGDAALASKEPAAATSEPDRAVEPSSTDVASLSTAEVHRLFKQEFPTLAKGRQAFPRAAWSDRPRTSTSSVSAGRSRTSTTSCPCAR